VKEALATCRSTLEKAIEDIDRVPVEESDEAKLE
jgi:hypothetical protein